MTDVRNATLEADGWHVTEIEPECSSITPAEFSMSLGSQGYTVSYTPEGCAEESEYTGPLDLVPGADWKPSYGFRALSAAMLGQNVVKLRRVSDDAELDFACDAVTGAFPTADVATWDGGLGSYIVTLYDHSGLGKTLSIADPNLQPEFIPSFIGGKPGLRFDGIEDYLVTADDVTLTGSNSVFSVHSRLEIVAGSLVGMENATDYWAINLASGGAGGINLDVYVDATGNECGGSFTPAEAPGETAYQMEAAWEFGTKSLKVNGVAAALAGNNDSGANPGNVTDKFMMGATRSATPTNFCAMTVAEYIGCGEVLSGANLSLVSVNQRTYFGL